MSWPIKRLDELMSIERGGSPRPIEQYITNDPNGLNWIKIGDATLSGKYIYETKEKIRPEGLKKSRFVEEGDFLLSNSMSFGRPYIMGTTGCIHDGWLVLKDTSGLLDKEYLYYALSSPVVFEQFDQLAAGSTVRNLNTRLVAGVTIPVPPKKEQQRIVGKLDAAFAALTEAQSHVERNRANARDLFESYLNGVFEGNGDWSREDLGTLGRIMYGYTASSTSEPVGPKLLRITDIQDELVEWTSVPHCQITDEDFTKYMLRSGDIVFARTGATTGKSFLIESAPEAVFASYLIRVQVEVDDLLPEFLILFFRTRLYWEAIKAGTTGSAQGGFNATKLSELVIPFPSKEEQRDIVRKANNLKDETKQLEATYQQKLTELAGLKKAVLGAAFRGEL